MNASGLNWPAASDLTGLQEKKEGSSKPALLDHDSGCIVWLHRVSLSPANGSNQLIQIPQQHLALLLLAMKNAHDNLAHHAPYQQ